MFKIIFSSKYLLYTLPHSLENCGGIDNNCYSFSSTISEFL